MTFIRRIGNFVLERLAQQGNGQIAPELDPEIVQRFAQALVETLEEPFAEELAQEDTPDVGLPDMLRHGPDYSKVATAS